MIKNIILSINIRNSKTFLFTRLVIEPMANEKTPKKRLLYTVIAIFVPIIGILVNHLYRPDHILLSLFFIVWMGFFIMALAPFEKEVDETVEP